MSALAQAHGSVTLAKLTRDQAPIASVYQCLPLDRNSSAALRLDRADLDQEKRLPFVSAADAQALLGPVAKKLPVPEIVKVLAHALATIGPSAVWTTPSTAPSTSAPSPSQAPTTPSNGHS